MIKGRLIRESTGDEGTFGTLVLPKLRLATAEPPWRGNQRNVSCIVPGVYRCVFDAMSRTVGGRRRLYRILETPGRAGVFIHAGNWAGDRSKGFKSDSLGCPLLGTHKGILSKQRAVLGSTTAITRLLEYLQGDPWELTIEEE
jgi:hypothetical protein